MNIKGHSKPIFWITGLLVLGLPMLMVYSAFKLRWELTRFVENVSSQVCISPCEIKKSDLEMPANSKVYVFHLETLSPVLSNAPEIKRDYHKAVADSPWYVRSLLSDDMVLKQMLPKSRNNPKKTLKGKKHG